MEYLAWVILALVAYSTVAPLTSVITREVPPTPALFLGTFIFLLITTAVLVVTGSADPTYLTAPTVGYVYAGGVALTIGILAYFYALEAGPVSIVVPIFGMFIAGSSVIGIIALDESLSLTQIAGLGSAIMAIVLGAGEGG